MGRLTEMVPSSGLWVAVRSPHRVVGEDFGGWPDATTKFFDEEAGIVPKIQVETGATGE